MTKEPPVRWNLRAEDWHVPVLDVAKVDCQSGDFVRQANTEQAQFIADIFESDEDKKGKFFPVTKEALSATVNASIPFKCMLQSDKGKLKAVDRYYTNVGTSKTTQKKKKNVAGHGVAPSLSIVNNTSKIVVQVVRSWASKKDWDRAVQNPGAFLRDTYEKWEIGKRVVHTMRPMNKTLGETTLIEQVIIVCNEDRQKFLRCSGSTGVFTKEFIDSGTSAEFSSPAPCGMAWSRSYFWKRRRVRRIYSEPRMLAWPMERMDWESEFIKNITKKAGNMFWGEVWKGVTADAKVYEVSQVPFWVQADISSKEFIKTLKWDTVFVRDVRGGQGTKKVLFRANTPPPVSAFKIGKSLLPIQLAPPPRRGNIVFKVFSGGSDGNTKNQKNRVKGSTVYGDLDSAMDGILEERLRAQVLESGDLHKRQRLS